MKKEITRHIINFTLIVSIIIFSLLAILKITILNKTYFLTKLESIDYYQEIYGNIINNFENNLLSSGIEEDVIKILVTKDIVTKDINNLVNSIYDNTNLELSTDIIKENFEEQINIILEHNNRIPTEEEQADIKLVENKLIEIYENDIKYLKYDMSNISEIIFLLNKTVIIIEIILGLIILNLFAINISIIRDFKKNIGTSLLATGMISIISKILIGKNYHYILFLNKTISNLVIAIINDLLKYTLIIGITLSIIGLILIIISDLSNKK